MSGTRDLERQLAYKTAQLAALREIGRAINAAWDLQATLELITRKTAEVIGMDSCSIYLLNETREYLVLEATTGLALESVGSARLRLGEGLTGWAAQTGEPVGVADAVRDPRFKYLPETEESIFQSLLAVPLVNQGRVIGAMNVQTRTYHQYGADEVELLSLIGDLAARALDRLHPHDALCVEVQGDEITLPSRSATALTLAVNELIQNALKHAFVGRNGGHVTVTLRRGPSGFEVEVRDDGVGLPVHEPLPRSLGLQIVETLVGQDLGGELRIERSEQGTCATIVVPSLEVLAGEPV